ncbi:MULTISPECIES: NAD(P)H-binding protein [Streptosporangium]|uniref:NAD(P)H dehydrogenase (Quinone) n=1 Tax=Streptosporangium brasiliense TaxID=47480 RepID=A0ABT9RFL5_9ACTN|nr:NAD(P)H-binding protein [Streptosporangium brasiliense]MDP9868050.1 NAD(P)H dehydrogenase (quinone) [Streptosporangium brasiliense]
MIVISAASGMLGRLVIDRLLTQVPAGEVVAVVRTPAAAADLAARGIQVRHGDYDDPAGLREAFGGARRLLLISSPELDPARRLAQHLAAVDAARAAGVGALAYTSFLGAGTDGTGVTEAHHATERAILGSGLPYTMLRHPYYSEAFLNSGLRAAVASGELTDSTGGRALNTASRADLAEAAANVLTGEGHLGRGYDFTGPLWTYPQLAQVLGQVSGVPVAYREVPDGASGALRWLNGQVRAGALETQTEDLQRVLGHPATSLRQAVTAVLAPSRSGTAPATPAG